jgi:hypothetical protein
MPELPARRRRAYDDAGSEPSDVPYSFYRTSAVKATAFL